MSAETGPKIYKNVKIGKNCQIDSGVEIGRPPRGKVDGELPTILGDSCVIRRGTIIHAGAVLGNKVQTGHGVVIREDNTVGDNSSLGTNSELAPGNKIGNNTRIHSQCFLEKTTIGDNVFIAPGVTFTDDKYPPSSLDGDWVKGATIGNYVVIGANSTFVPGVNVGDRAFIGAGSVVTKDIPAGKLAVGNPARIIKDVSELEEDRGGTIVRPYK